MLFKEALAYYRSLQQKYDLTSQQYQITASQGNFLQSRRIYDVLEGIKKEMREYESKTVS